MFDPRCFDTCQRRSTMLPPTRSTTPIRDCPLCGKHRSTVAYARAAQVRVFIPAYHRFERGLLIAAYQQEQIDRFRRLLDYDRVLDWARTTRRAVVGIVHQKSRHPLRCYLNDVDPSTTDRPRWDVYLSPSDALHRSAHTPHNPALPIF